MQGTIVQVLVEVGATVEVGQAILVLESAGSVRAQDEIATPGGQLERESHATLIFAVDRNRLIAKLPSVAIGTVKHAAPIQLLDAVDLRKVVAHSGGNQQLP